MNREGLNVTDEEILRLFERHGMQVELGAQFSAKGQIAQLLNGCRELLRKYEADALRDQIAIAAMQTMIAGGGYQKREDISNDAYDMADAMLQERKK